MKKHFFVILCVLCMVLSLVPVTICAADPSSGENYQYNTTVVDHFANGVINGTLELTKGSQYIVDIKDDKTINPVERYLQLSSDGSRLVNADNQDEAIISITTIPEENKAVVTFTGGNLQTNLSGTLQTKVTSYTGSVSTYGTPVRNEDTGRLEVDEQRDDYYFVLQFDCTYHFIVEPPAEVINEAVISNVKMNYKAGEAPQKSAEPVFADGVVRYEVVYECWEEIENGNPVAFWYSDESQYTLSMKRITQFEAGKLYRYAIVLREKSGYAFADDCIVKIGNTEVAWIRNSADQTLQFSDAVQLTMQPEVTPPDYKITEGENGAWTQNSDGTLTFHANGDLANFTGVKVDGTLIGADQYTAVSGSTVITLKTGFLATLSVGEHILTVVYKDGACSTKFQIKAAQSVQPETTEKDNTTTAETTDKDNTTTVKKSDQDNTATAEKSDQDNATTSKRTDKDNATTSDKTDKNNTTTGKGGTASPKTGDNSNLMLWITLLLASGGAAIGTEVIDKRKK